MASEPSRSRQDSDWDVRNPFRHFKLTSYLKEELIQSVRKHQEQAGSEDRGPFNNRMYTFLTVPQYLESFMCYGLLQCLDQMLLIYTLLPLRCLLVVWRLFLYLLRHVTSRLLGLLTLLQPRSPEQLMGGGGSGLLLYSHELRDICRLTFIAICSGLLAKFDTSVAYHEIRTQSVVKIYIFFNLLEVADRLLSSVCQDALDDLFHTVSETLQTCCNHPPAKMSDRHKEIPRCCSEPETEEDFRKEGDVGSGSSAEQGHAKPLALARDLFFQFGFALICLFSHCFLLMCQVTTLNVAFNSVNKSLVTVFISNNFVELKGNVFRKMGKTNLFQIACADVRERFHYFIWLFIVVSRNMTDTGWNLDELWEMLFDVVCIFLAEVAVDWVKHAFITKFNVIPSDVYREYTVSLAFDLLLCRQGNNTSDYFDLLSRRMGLTPIPLSCLINVMLLQTVRTSSPFFYCTLPSMILGLFTLKILVNVWLLSTAYSHVKAYIKVTQAANQQQAPTSDKFAVSCAPLVVTSTNDIQPNGQRAEKPQKQREDVTTLAVDNVAGRQQLSRYGLPLTLDEQSFWSPTMVLRHRRVRMQSETSSVRCRTASPLHQPGSEPCDGQAGGSDPWSSGWTLDRSPSWSIQAEGHDMAAAAATDVALVPNASPEPSSSVGLAFYTNTTSNDSTNQLLLPLNDTEPVGPQQLYASNTAPGMPLLSSSLLVDHRVEDTGASYDDGALPAATAAGQHQQVMAGRKPDTTGLRRSFSIDMGVLSALSRQLTHNEAQRRRAEEEKTSTVPQLVALGYPTTATTTDDHQHAAYRRRSRRSRTNTYSSGGALPASLRAVRWEEDVLPVLWEKSSRSSVARASPGLTMAARQNRSPPLPDGDTLVPQPLPNIDRYSMLEGQIS